MKNFPWLLKREYWENRGGFLWAPIIASIVWLSVLALGLLAVELGLRRNVMVNNIRLSDLTEKVSPDQLAKFGAGIDLALVSFTTPIMFVLSIVLFFYLLGALYDDRRDRSVLFWKSLPISDFDTVMSKVVSALVVAPIISLVVSLALVLGVMLLLSIVAGLHGVNPITMIWMTASPLTVMAKMALMLPVNMLWALPTVGWLLMWSAYAKRGPFLWAVLVPVATGIMVSMFDLMRELHMPDFSFWKNVVVRLLGSVFPTWWFDLGNIVGMKSRGDTQGLMDVVGLPMLGNALMLPSMWIGAVAGVAMIAAAVWLRRWRDDN